MRRVRKGNVIYLVEEEKDTMQLRCSCCGKVKNELDIEEKDGVLTCDCGSSSFIVQGDLEELI